MPLLILPVLTPPLSTRFALLRCRAGQPLAGAGELPGDGAAAVAGHGGDLAVLVAEAVEHQHALLAWRQAVDLGESVA